METRQNCHMIKDVYFFCCAHILCLLCFYSMHCLVLFMCIILYSPHVLYMFIYSTQTQSQQHLPLSHCTEREEGCFRGLKWPLFHFLVIMFFSSIQSCELQNPIVYSLFLSIVLSVY